MRPLATVAGLLIIALGIVALASGEVNASWGWFLAAACAVVGITGLVSATRR